MTTRRPSTRTRQPPRRGRAARDARVVQGSRHVDRALAKDAVQSSIATSSSCATRARRAPTHSTWRSTRRRATRARRSSPTVRSRPCSSYAASETTIETVRDARAHPAVRAGVGRARHSRARRTQGGVAQGALRHARDAPSRRRRLGRQRRGRDRLAHGYHHRAAALEDTLIGMAAGTRGRPTSTSSFRSGSLARGTSTPPASAAYVSRRAQRPASVSPLPSGGRSAPRARGERGADGRAAHVLPGDRASARARRARHRHGVVHGRAAVPPVDVVDATLRVLDDAEVPPLVPWYRGFGGEIDAEPTEDGSPPVAPSASRDSASGAATTST